MSETPFLEVKNLSKTYEVRRLFRGKAFVRALDGVSFQLQKGKTLAIVGESGCGKSTLAKCLMRIEKPTGGEIRLGGRRLEDIPVREWWRNVQMIFQDPYSSLNPRKKVIDLIAEPLVIAGGFSKNEIRVRAKAMMAKVGLRPEFEERYPHMLSGGQRQRVGIARALILKPQLLICDEPVSALDISIQAQVLNLLMDLQDEFGLTYLFISHDLSLVRHIADDVLVMYLGQVMELGSREKVLFDPQHPYTKALLASHPDFDKALNGQLTLEGELPSPLNPPVGCPFQSRCPRVMAVCRERRPPLFEVKSRECACHLYTPDPSDSARVSPV